MGSGGAAGAGVEPRRLEGVSTYRLDRKGRVYHHHVDNVVLRDPPVVLGLPVWDAAGLFASPGGATAGAPVPFPWEEGIREGGCFSEGARRGGWG